MKKFLTVLLVVSVLFTFSFSSAFAATYTVEDYLKAYTEQLEDSIDALKSLKKSAAKLPTYDADGFAYGYAKAAIEAAIDAYIADVEEEGEDYIDYLIEAEFGTDSETSNAPGKELVLAAMTAEDLLDDAMTANLEDANKANAPIVKEFVEKEAAKVDPADYSDKAADRGDFGSYTNITPREYVEALADDFAKALKQAEKDYTAKEEDRFLAYFDALEVFEDAVEEVPTLEDAEIADKESVKDVAGAVNAFMDAAYDFYEANAFKAGTAADTVTFKAFYDADAKTLFGVKVKDFTDLTKKEASALNDALYDIIRAAEDVVEEACDTVAEVEALYLDGDVVDEGKLVKTLYNTTKVEEAYAKVVAYGEKLKKAYFLGEKKYDDAAIDEVVEAAKEAVYADLNGEFDDAEDYFWDTQDAEDIDVAIDNGVFEDFMKAQREAMEKMVQADGTYTKSVKYGADKTPAEDYVYLAEEYAYVEDWEDIAFDAIEALAESQSYEEIEAIMADAAADFAKLIKADEVDKEEVEDAILGYIAALADHQAECEDLADMSDYTMGQFDAAFDAGADEIADAKTVAEAKAAYAEAKALFNDLLTDDEIEAEAKEVKALINKLPYNAKLTAADKDAVVEAIEAYQEYMDILADEEELSLGTAAGVLYDKAVIVFEDIEEALDEEVKDVADAVAEAADGIFSRDDYFMIDGGMDAFLATKADAEAMVAEYEEFMDLVDDMDLEEDIDLDNADYDYLKDLLKLVDEYWTNDQNEDMTYWYAEVIDAEMALIQASKSGASIAEMQAAKEAYKALTEKQQLYLADDLIMNGYGLEMLYVIDARLTNTVETLKITARSSAKKGSITVKWDVEGDTACVEAYEIWKSTKHSSGYKKAFTTTKMSYKNTKGLEKGTRYYYKVRAIAYDMDGDKVKSDWSNKARRIAK